MEYLGNGLREMFEVRESLVYGCLCGVRMTVMLDSNAEHPEAVVSDGVVLDPGFVFQDVVDRLGEKADEGVSFRCGDEYATQLELQDFADPIERRLELCCRIPCSVLARS